MHANPALIDTRTLQRALTALAGRDAEATAPYAFAEFERRVALRHGPEAAKLRIVARVAWPDTMAASIVVLMIALLALWQPLRGANGREASLPVPDAQWIHPIAGLTREPALVRVGTYVAVTALEDRLAWIDDRLSDGRVLGGVPIDLHLLDEERQRIEQSLLRVRYAEALASNYR